MTCRLLPLIVVLCARMGVRAAQELNGRKVAIVMREEPENPKCFAEGQKDLTCFWEEDEERAGPVEQYSFTYAYQNENGSRCPLVLVPTAGGRRLYVCRLTQTHLFTRMDIKIQRHRVLIHNRSLLIETLILLDPPVNVTVTRTGQQGQLMVRWLPPPLKYMDDSMMYQVAFSEADAPAAQVEEVNTHSELVLRGLQPGTKYQVRVRVKLDGISFNGFWSEWSEPVLMETLPAELNPLVVSLTAIVLLVFMVLALMVFRSYRRHLMRKIWPDVPSPDNKFQDLFTSYGGDFQAWMGHTVGPLWLGPPLVLSEERLSALEVLSELSPSLPPPLPPKTSRSPSGTMKEERGDSAERWGSTAAAHLSGTPRHPPPCSHASLLESQDAYISLSGQENPEENLEEAVPLEVLFPSRKATRSESPSDLGSGRLSSQSSGEYPGHSWVHKGSGYTYMAVADSGVSMDYSPMSRPEDVAKVLLYANDIPAHRKHVLSRQPQES
ncbi:erythropoietin receptor isoform X2 [Synchiropus splendidus]|uniref:erythropoietin receptor isoform X2 n=1 Tax=Synchiropus splendidus TaxID=270530 RepID=UPI00237EDEF8|nr:erythropoietin receptor isoform X2 [Synchiropus splendidus]